MTIDLCWARLGQEKILVAVRHLCGPQEGIQCHIEAGIVEDSEEALGSRYVSDLDRVFPLGHAGKNPAGSEADGPD